MKTYVALTMLELITGAVGVAVVGIVAVGWMVIS